MPRPRKWESELQRRQAQNDARKVSRETHPVEFIGVDGEGAGKWRGHRYVLLGVGDQQISNGDGLRFGEIAEFLWEQYQKRPKAAFVGFYLGYDFTQWLKTLPENRARMLLTGEGKAKRVRRNSGGNPTPFPVDYDGWEFDILGSKRFKLRKAGMSSWMYICDAGSFFQASLMSVIDPAKWNDPVVTEEEYAILKEGKAKRDSAALGPDMRRYNVLENDVLSRLMGRLNVGFVEAGIRLKRNQWFGPGQAAQEWLKSTELPRRGELSGVHGRPRPSSRLHGTSEIRPVDAGRLTYYGGWFEIFAHGHVPGRSFEYDINSAYPYITSRLPCLLHGRWQHGDARDYHSVDRGSVCAIHARVRGTDRRLGAMLHRLPDGTIRRPSATSGWYWEAELRAAARAGAVDSCEIDEWLRYDPCDCRPPLRGLAGLYDQRLAVGKNTPAGKSYKLIYNSVYGKLAQSVGKPKFANPIYASLITSGTRELILDAIASHPAGSDNLLMVATDGVYFRSPHPSLVLSDKIGEWSETIKENLTLFKPGVYWDDSARKRIADGQNPSFKARGVNAAEFAKQLSHIDDLFRQWPDRYPVERDPDGPRDGWYPKITFRTRFAMVTAQQALQRGKWYLAGAVSGCDDECTLDHQHHELVQDSDPITKRHSGYYEDGVYWSKPYKDPGAGDMESTPYDKSFGMEEDPEVYGITPDGLVLDHWKRMLQP
jgi:hypothetical protein